MPRRLPPPWRIEKMPGGYVVRDANGQTLAFIYSRATEAEATPAARRRRNSGTAAGVSRCRFTPFPWQ
jgi:hypothetical protein